MSNPALLPPTAEFTPTLVEAVVRTALDQVGHNPTLTIRELRATLREPTASATIAERATQASQLPIDTYQVQAILAALEQVLGGASRIASLARTLRVPDPGGGGIFIDKVAARASTAQL